MLGLSTIVVLAISVLVALLVRLICAFVSVLVFEYMMSWSFLVLDWLVGLFGIICKAWQAVRSIGKECLGEEWSTGVYEHCVD